MATKGWNLSSDEWEDTGSVLVCERTEADPGTSPKAAEAELSREKVAELPPSTLRVLHEHFERLRSPEVARQAAERRFWAAAGAEALRQLIEWMDRPMEMLHLRSISALLAAIPERSLSPVLDALERGVSEQQAGGLLSVLSGIDRSALLAHQPRIARLIGRYLKHTDDAVRTTAASAVSALGDAQALALLQWALRTEQDPDVIDALNGELEERSRV
jgi:hypothetical protein